MTPLSWNGDAADVLIQDGSESSSDGEKEEEEEDDKFTAVISKLKKEQEKALLDNRTDRYKTREESNEGNESVTDRLFRLGDEFKKRKEEDLKLAKQKQLAKEMSEVTFKPKINELVDNRPRKSWERIESRTPDLLKNKQMRIAKASLLLSRKEMEDFTFQPKICRRPKSATSERTKGFLDRQQEEEAKSNQRLRTLCLKSQSECTGKPVISAYAQKVKRVGQVHERLYEASESRASVRVEWGEGDSATTQTQLQDAEAPSCPRSKTIQEKEGVPSTSTQRKLSKTALLQTVENLSRNGQVHEAKLDLLRLQHKRHLDELADRGTVMSSGSKAFFERRLEKEFIAAVLSECDPDIGLKGMTFQQAEMVLRTLAFLLPTSASDRRLELQREEESLMSELWEAHGLDVEDTLPIDCLFEIISKARAMTQHDYKRGVMPGEDEGYTEGLEDIARALCRMHKQNLTYLDKARYTKANLPDSGRDEQKLDWDVESQTEYQSCVSDVSRPKQIAYGELPYGKSPAYQQRLVQLKREFRRKEVEECTFQPNLSASRRVSSSALKQDRQRLPASATKVRSTIRQQKRTPAVSHMALRDLEDALECTFKPDVERSRLKPKRHAKERQRKRSLPNFNTYSKELTMTEKVCNTTRTASNGRSLKTTTTTAPARSVSFCRPSTAPVRGMDSHVVRYREARARYEDRWHFFNLRVASTP